MTRLPIAMPIALALMASTAMAESTRNWPDHMAGPEGDSYVTIHEPTVEHAAATVTFQNRHVHSGDDEFPLTFGDITIIVSLDFNVDALGSERLTIEPPAGYVAVPRTIDVKEDEALMVQIIEYLGG